MYIDIYYDNQSSLTNRKVTNIKPTIINKTQPLLKYEPFDFFGEVPFFKSEIRNYIVKADTDCHVLVINKKEFKRLVGTLENILKRKNEIYQKYMKK